jgi:succinate-semialdehyde dehydrogenase / glutarate-semialdehyde dehydrogenase
MTPVAHQAELVIGPEAVAANGHREQLAVINPADQTVVGYAPVADAGLVDAAVTSATEAFRGWSARPAAQRAGHLVQIAAWIRSSERHLAHRLTLEQGKPLSEAASEVETAARAFDFYAAEAVRVDGQVIATESATLRSLVIRQPFGVVAAITTCWPGTPGWRRSALPAGRRPVGGCSSWPPGTSRA